MIFLIRRIIKSKEYSSHKCHKIRQTQAYEQRASVLSAEMGDYMNDKSLECIRFYTFYDKKLDASLEEEGIEPEEPFRMKDIWLIITNKGGLIGILNKSNI